MDSPEGFKEGDSIVDFFSLKKWIEEVDDDVVFNNAKKKVIGANNESPPKGWSIPYYDIESLRKHIKLVENDKDIILLEKINGCVTERAIIETLEYGNISISKLRTKTTNVKSMDIKSGEISFQECFQVFENGESDNWFEIELENGEKIEITGNHLVWMPELNCYREVSNLQIDDEVLIS
jgi:hypothetical protein